MTAQRTIDIVSGDWWGTNPHDDFAWMRANAPAYFDEGNGVWGISRYDDVKAISKDSSRFSNAGGIRPETGGSPMMIDMDDPDHVRRRKLVNSGFTPGRVRAQEPRVRAVVSQLIDRVGQLGECDFVTDLAAWLPLIVIGDAIGFEESDHSQLLEWSDDMVSGLGQPAGPMQDKMGEAAAGCMSYLAGAIEERRTTAQDDLLSVLAHAEIDGDRLDDDALVMESLLLLIAGDETTRHVMTGGLYQLLASRERWEAIRSDRDLLPGAIEEMLRWVSPVRNMARTATEDVELHGETIRAGQKVLLLYPSANRDGAHFPDPMRFDIRRTPNEHIAFGFGPHFCLGSALARLELTAMFDCLLDRLPDLELVDLGEPAHRAANFVSGYEHMRVRYSAPLDAGTIRTLA